MGFGHRNTIVIVMVGVFGFLLGSFGINSSNNDLSLQTDSVFALGHLQLIVTDADGNIKQYMQTDNLITNEGANTMADLIFPISGPGLNNNSTDTKFGVIGIGTGTSGPGVNDVSLESPISGCANQTASSVFGDIQADLGAGTPQGAEVGLLAFFNGGSPTGCTGTITEAVLQNDIFGKGEVLSRQVFTPGIVLGDADFLNVDWFIEIGA